MADKARSDDPAVQRQLDRLERMTGGRDILGRARLRRLLARLGNPETCLPPTFHVAGTNGKGSTCTYLRGAIAAAGRSAHVYTSPHLVRLNERIRVAGELITDAALAALLAEVIDAAEGDETTFFEAITAAALLAFARTPADACIVEVGIGGRLDATNVLPTAAACGIAQLGLDHQAFLGNTLVEIAGEKAGIAKRGTPLVTQAYEPALAARVAEVAAAAGAPVLAQGVDWTVATDGDGVRYADHHGDLRLPIPALAGPHQLANAGLAIAMLRGQSALRVPSTAFAPALANARWPARLARLGDGPYRALFPRDARLWLDGAHNVAAMRAMVEFFRPRVTADRPLDVVIGLLADKDAPGVLACLAELPLRLEAVSIEGYDCWSPDALCTIALGHGIAADVAEDLRGAARRIAARDGGGRPATVLLTGSLYLAGQILRANGEFPA